MRKQRYFYAHRINSAACRQRLRCIRSCPTRALRVREGQIKIYDDLCINCGLCVEACPSNVFEPIKDSLADFDSFKIKIALPSSIMYTQFGPESHPLIIDNALKKLGFDAVANLAPMCAEVGYAIKLHLRENPNIRPLISVFCPAVVRLIQVAFPNLVKNIVALDVPREITAAQIKRQYAEKEGVDISDIGVIYITPCTAKVASIKEPAEKEKSWIDGAIPIRDIYNMISSEVIKNSSQKFDNLKEEFEYGKAWGILGHFSQDVGPERSIAVAGINHVKNLLNDIENDKLYNIDFVEALACYQGCTGGIFCVKDPYVARHNSYRLQKKFGSKMKIDMESVTRKYDEGHYFNEYPLLPRSTRELNLDLRESLKQMKKKKRIFSKLPGNDCGVCGSPTCEVFAADCARGEAELTDCIFI